MLIYLNNWVHKNPRNYWPSPSPYGNACIALTRKYFLLDVTDLPARYAGISKTKRLVFSLLLGP